MSFLLYVREWPSCEIDGVGLKRAHISHSSSVVSASHIQTDLYCRTKYVCTWVSRIVVTGLSLNIQAVSNFQDKYSMILNPNRTRVNNFRHPLQYSLTSRSIHPNAANARDYVKYWGRSPTSAGILSTWLKQEWNHANVQLPFCVTKLYSVRIR
jgi:hypothetical protein